MLTIKKTIACKKALIACGVLSLFSCSSAPPLLSPSKALVNTNMVNFDKSIPLKYNKYLNGGSQKSKMFSNGQKISLGAYYTSALGQKCRTLFISEETDNSSTTADKVAIYSKRVVCKQKEQESWVLIPAIVEQVNNRAIFAD